jgi:uncharacterized protein (TIRG00374 family)
MSFRSGLSVVTIVLIGLIIFASRKELLHAWELLSQVHLLVLLIILPVAALAYVAAGEMIFSYLRQKGQIRDIKPWTLARISLELNFVNHVLPSGGVSGISYMNWRLGKYGVAAGKATVAQMVRYVAGFAALATLLVLSVIIVTIDGNINRWIILMSSAIVTVMIVATLLLIYLVKSPTRLQRFSKFVTRNINKCVRMLTFGHKPELLNDLIVNAYFQDMHDDYLSLARDKRVLIQPYLWGLLFTIAEITIFFVAFLALGTVVNPAPILIAYGVASFAGFIVMTPGGAGAYEAIMVFILAAAGLSGGDAIAGVLLSRVIILLSTIGLGYIFYQRALIKYGKRGAPDLHS